MNEGVNTGSNQHSGWDKLTEALVIGGRALVTSKGFKEYWMLALPDNEPICADLLFLRDPFKYSVPDAAGPAMIPENNPSASTNPNLYTLRLVEAGYIFDTKVLQALSNVMSPGQNLNDMRIPAFLEAIAKKIKSVEGALKNFGDAKSLLKQDLADEVTNAEKKMLKQYYDKNFWKTNIQGKTLNYLNGALTDNDWPKKYEKPPVKDDRRYMLFFIAHAKKERQKDVAKLFGIKLQEKKKVGGASAPQSAEGVETGSESSEEDAKRLYTKRELVPTDTDNDKEIWWNDFRLEFLRKVNEKVIDPRTVLGRLATIQDQDQLSSHIYVNDNGDLCVGCDPASDCLRYNAGPVANHNFYPNLKNLRVKDICTKRQGRQLCEDLGLNWTMWSKQHPAEYLNKINKCLQQRAYMPKVRHRHKLLCFGTDPTSKATDRCLGIKVNLNDSAIKNKKWGELGESSEERKKKLLQFARLGCKESLAELLKYKGPLPLPLIPLAVNQAANVSQTQSQTDVQPPAGVQTNNPPDNPPGAPPPQVPPAAPVVAVQPAVAQTAPTPTHEEWWNAFRKEAFQKYNLMLLKKTKKCSNCVFLKHTSHPTRHDLIIGGKLYRGYGKDDKKYYAYNPNDTDNPQDADNDPVTVGEVFTERLGKDLRDQLAKAIITHNQGGPGTQMILECPKWETLKKNEFGEYMITIYNIIRKLSANELPPLKKFKLSDKEYNSRQKKIDKHYLKSYIDAGKWALVKAQTLQTHNGGNTDLTKDTWKKNLLRYAKSDKRGELAKMLGVKEIPASKSNCVLRWKWWNNFRDEIFLKFNEKLIEVGGSPFEPLSEDQHPSDDMLLAGGSCFRGFDRKSNAYKLSPDDPKKLIYMRGDYNNTEVKIKQIVSDRLGRKLYEKLKKLDEEYNGKTHSSWGGIVSELSMKGYIEQIHDMVKSIPAVQLPTKIFLSEDERDKRWKKVEERFLKQFPIGLTWKEMKKNDIMHFSNKTDWQDNLLINAEANEQKCAKLKELLNEKPKKKATTPKTCPFNYTWSDVYNGVSTAITQLFPSIFSLKTWEAIMNSKER